MSTVQFKYRRFNDRSGYVPAMHTMADIVEDTELHSGDGFSTVWAKQYGNWITDEIIDIELVRNIIMDLVCVMICTMILIADWQICLWVFVCILLTLVRARSSLLLLEINSHFSFQTGQRLRWHGKLGTDHRFGFVHWAATCSWPVCRLCITHRTHIHDN